MFAAAVGHRSGRATPSLRDAPQQQSMEIVGRETIYRNRNAVQTNPATSSFRRGGEVACLEKRFGAPSGQGDSRLKFLLPGFKRGERLRVIS